MRYALLLTLIFLSSCSQSPSGSDEWWFNKMQRDTRTHCNTLPAEVKAQCLEQMKQSYEEFQKKKMTPDNVPSLQK